MPKLEDLLPEKTDVEVIETLLIAEHRGYSLYREATILIGIAAHTYAGPEVEYPLSRNDAILSGLLIRIFKYMGYVAKAASNRIDAELIQTLNRCILESVINLELLLSPNSTGYFDEYVEKSLGPERELFDEIQKNIIDRGGNIVAIEERMLRSIDRVAHASGKKIEEIDKKSGQWAGNFRNRLRLLDKEDLYLYHQRLGSHSIHGTWVDLYTNHLHEDPDEQGKFKTRPTKRPDARLLTPVASHVTVGLKAYCVYRFHHESSMSPLLAAVEDLLRRLIVFEAKHEDLFGGVAQI